MHVESIEPRRLMSAGIDTSFGTRGVVQPPNANAVYGLLAAGGAVYAETSLAVDGVSAGSGIYKYTDAGKLDTTWGDHGLASFGNFTPGGESVMAYDARTKSLWVAGVTATGGTDGGSAFYTLDVAEFDARGKEIDAVPHSGASGQSIYDYGTAVLSLDKIVPLAHGKVLVLYDRETQTDDNADDNGYDPDQTYQDEVLLLRLRPDGTRDNTFGHKGASVVDSGDRSYHREVGRIDQAFDVPTGSDLQVNADGSYRVVGTRRRGTQVLDDAGDDRGQSLFVDALVDSTPVRSDGTAVEARRRVWTVARSHASTRTTTGTLTEFHTLAAVASGDDGVTAVGGRSPSTDVYFRFTPGVRPPATELPGVRDTPIGVIVQGPGGVLLGLSNVSSLSGSVNGSGNVTAVEYTPRLKINDGFANNGRAAVEDQSGYFDVVAAVDERGRAVVASRVGQSTDGIILQRFASR